MRLRPVADVWSPNTKTGPGRPGRSLNGRACPFIRLHFISTSSAPTVSRSRSMYLDGPVKGGVSSSSHEHDITQVGDSESLQTHRTRRYQPIQSNDPSKTPHDKGDQLVLPAPRLSAPGWAVSALANSDNLASSP